MNVSAAHLERPADESLDAVGDARGLRLQAAERLAAHRLRRSRIAHASGSLPGFPADDGNAPEKPVGRRKVAAAVAERYAQSPSYRAFLAQEAQRAISQAEAAAEIAARSAEAVVAVQQELLAELELWTAPQHFAAATAIDVAPRVQTPMAAEAEDRPARELIAGGVTVKLYEDLGRVALPVRMAATRPEFAAGEEQALEEEIEFRKAPVFEDFRGPASAHEPIAANLIEFPRQLVAPRKVRPRLAEGPLLEETTSRSGQLRIFEVEAEQVAAEPVAAPAAPEWSSIWLEAHSTVEAHSISSEEHAAILPSLLPPQTAPVATRLMAAAVDVSLVTFAFLLFAGVASWVAKAVPTGSVALLTAAPVLAVFYLAYQLLFFSFSGDTPGMRYARIGLCTFSDENPSRSAMRRRVWSTVIAACPFGLGLLWAMLDDDRLGWHDRMSRMYQRAY